MGADHDILTLSSRLGQSAELKRAYALGVIALPELHNTILVEVFNAPDELAVASIFDAISKEFSAEALMEVTRAINLLENEGLLKGKDTYIEPACGTARRKDIYYSLTQRGKMHLLGLVLWNQSLEVADSTILTAQQLVKDGTTVGNRGGEAFSLFPSPPLNPIDVEIERVARIMDESALCVDCERPASHECACGRMVCQIHKYDADGNHTLDPKDGICGQCVEAVHEQTWGEQRNGIAGQQ